MKQQILKTVTIAALAAGLSLATAAASADTYQVTVTNLTYAQTFTPRLAITHSAGNAIQLGEPAIDEVAIIAESGDVSPMMDFLSGFDDLLTDMQVGEGLLMPGDSQSIMVEGEPGDRFTLLNMLIPTNDAFLAVNGVALPESGSLTVHAIAYDAGSEPNDERCSSIPGPTCGGEANSAPQDDDEGYVHVHRGIHGVGDLEAARYDWNNPVAAVTIQRM